MTWLVSWCIALYVLDMMSKSQTVPKTCNFQRTKSERFLQIVKVQERLMIIECAASKGNINCFTVIVP